MANPFEKRATEYLRDDEAFLALVTPEPLVTFFKTPAREERLYDRLSVIIGTPGSGKTTLARLFEFTALSTLLGNREMTNYRPLIDALTGCGAIEEGRPTLVGARLPLQAEYRDFWEFEYPDELKTGLMIELLQARSVLAWLRNVEAVGVPLEDVTIVARSDADAALTEIGGTEGRDLRERARVVERAIYRISAALLPPDVGSIDREASAAYRPFDVIEAFRIRLRGETLELRPLVIFDDAHSLHPSQLVALRRWLSQRELKVSRWVLTRLDALTPSDVLLGDTPDFEESALKRSREMTVIWMQGGESRRKQRRAFRTMAKDMAGRYLTQMEVFRRRRLSSLGDLLPTVAAELPAGKRQQLRKEVDVVQRGRGVPRARRVEFEKLIDDYLANTGETSEALRLGILSVLFERHASRVQPSLFGDDEEMLELSRPLKVDSGVADGARIHLLHKYELPYFFGIDTLSDASTENAEQFLQLSARLVSQSETQLIRGKSATLPSGLQHKLLRERATQMVDEWNFPQCRFVRRIADGIAAECVAKSLEGNASLRGGATAFGIPQDEFDNIPKDLPHLAQALQFGVAYNAFVLVPNHSTKKTLWCLIELGGVLRLHHGLTLRRGGFLERRSHDLVRLMDER